MRCGGQYFRAGAGALIINHFGYVLAFERSDIPGAWQLPQGGLEEGEEPYAAILREIEEETGITEGNLKLLERCSEPLVYELPPQLRSAKTGRGQVQYWFLLRYRGPDAGVNLQGGGEFRAWRWMPYDELLANVADFRRLVYEQLKRTFARYLEGVRS